MNITKNRQIRMVRDITNLGYENDVIEGCESFKYLGTTIKKLCKDSINHTIN